MGAGQGRSRTRQGSKTGQECTFSMPASKGGRHEWKSFKRKTRCAAAWQWMMWLWEEDKEIHSQEKLEQPTDGRDEAR